MGMYLHSKSLLDEEKQKLIYNHSPKKSYRKDHLTPYCPVKPTFDSPGIFPSHYQNSDNTAEKF